MRTPLVQLVLTATFRPERHGKALLDEVLPEECPIDGDGDAWRELVEAQVRYRETGVVDPWEFAGLVRDFARGEQPPDPPPRDHKRDQILNHLANGPFARRFSRDLPPSGERFEPFGDAELRAVFETAEREWDEHTYAYHRFVVGLDRDAAVAAMLDARGLPDAAAWVRARADS